MKWFRREAELDEEIRAHIRMAIQDRVRAGEDPIQARREVMREFGGVARTMEDTRAVWRWQWLEQTRTDARFAIRTLAKSPGFAAAAILSLALGVGATTALISVLHHVAFRPLAFEAPDRLAIAWSLDPRVTPPIAPASFPDWQDWRTGTHRFSTLAAFRNRPGFLLRGDGAEQVELHEVSPDFLPALGIAPALGRLWSEGEAEAAQAAVISDALWKDAFDGARDVLGRRVVISQAPYEIIGVMPPGFASPSMGGIGIGAAIRLSPPHSVWTPLVIRLRATRQSRKSRVAYPGAASARCDRRRQPVPTSPRCAARLATAYPQANRGITADLVPLAESVTGAVRMPLAALAAAAGLFLLIACANVAGLLLARDAGRRREFATRAALGASRARLVRQSLTESAVLAFAGGVAGIAIASAMLTSARRASAVLDVPRLAESTLDFPALAVALAISTGAALLFGLIPALRAASMRDNRSTADRRSVRLRQTLIGASTAVTFVLVFSAILLLASFRNLTTGRGASASRTYTFQVTLSGTRWMRSPLDQQFYASLLDRVRAMPRVDLAAVTTGLLNIGDESGSLAWMAGGPPAPPDRRPIVGYTMASGDFFRLAGLALREGRVFNARDRTGAPEVAVVNEAFVRSVSPDAGVLGRQVTVLGVGAGPMQIVGVVADDVPFRPGEQARPRLFYPYTQSASPRFIGMVRTEEGAPPPIDGIRAIVRDLDAALPVFEVQSVEAIVGKATSSPRWSSTLVAGFAAMALLLAAIGVMGTVAYCASQRKKECGIRLALGAAPQAVGWLVARQGVWPVLAGIVAGLVATRLIEPLFRGLLFGVAAGALQPILLCVGLLAIAAGIAAFFPARRATAIDPASTLRCD